MKRNLIKVLVIIMLVLSVILIAMCGYVWYRESHVFVEDTAYARNLDTLDLRGSGVSTAHVMAVRAKLPGCEVFWDVPFQGKTVSSDVTELTITKLEEKDFAQIAYLQNLKKIDASACGEYALLEQLREKFPKVEVNYQISIGALSVATDETGLTLNPEDFDLDTLMENLPYLPELTSISLPKTTLTPEQIDALAAGKEGLTVNYTVDFLGEEVNPDLEELDLSWMKSSDVEKVAAELAVLRGLKKVELMTSAGASNLTTADVKALKDAAPGVSFHYEFMLLGQKISTTETTTVTFTNKFNIKDANEPEIRMALDLMENCERFVLDNCSVSSKVCAQIREDYRDKTKFVWRVFFGKDGSCLTDREVIRVVYGLTDDNCGGLQYCEDARFMDIGHNEYLDAIPFVANMPKLEAIIISGAPIKSLEPFANCENLVFLEASNCSYITDLTPLKNCKKLEMLNLSFTSVTDMSPVDELPLKSMIYIYNDLSPEEEARFIKTHPDCYTLMEGEQPYGRGWRTDEKGNYAGYYLTLASPEVFDYFGSPNNTQW